jgi:hypothetical protein
MLLRIEIPKQEEDYFEVEVSRWITTSIISSMETEDSVIFVLDHRISNPTTGCEVFTSATLIIWKNYYGLRLTFEPAEEDELDYFELKVSSVKVVENFLLPF